VVSLNLNGLRSAIRKGFASWLLEQNADIVCVQEIRLREADLTKQMTKVGPYSGIFHHAERPGYSGVGIYTKKTPDYINFESGAPEINREGRYLEIKFGELIVVSIYAPSGSSSPERLGNKFQFMKLIKKKLKSLSEKSDKIIICGDINIAHKQIDLKNWRGNQKNSGFLPEEREWLTKIMVDYNLVDVFRALNQNAGEYTWWSNRGKAYENNVGWRIDYQLASPKIAEKAVKAIIYKDKKFSDHAPLIIDYANEA